jgi:hypothetical protein
LACAILAVSFKTSCALEVAAGCDEPRSGENGKTFFVDPTRGSRDNDGSERLPWRTLAEVLDPANHLVATSAYSRTKDGLGQPEPINPAGPVKPGDTIVLMSGDHGNVNARQYVNSDFISVVAGKGQTPVVRSLLLISSSHWLFRGIKFQGAKQENEKGGTLVSLASHNWLGPSDNMVMADDSFSSVDSTETWAPDDWVNKPYDFAFISGARCTTLTDSHFFNVRNAVMMVGGGHSLVEDNLIEDMGNDGLDVVTSDLVVRRNRIRHGRHSPVEPLHADGIQGWTLNGATNSNVVIDSNWIINVDQSPDNYLQGISIFDGKWDGLTVTNNLVINNTWHAISLYGVTNALVANNTVIPARADRASWLMIHDAKDKTPSLHVVVRNNIAPEFVVEGQDVEFDHNLAEKEFQYRQIGGEAIRLKQGGFGNHNTIHPGLFHWFVDFDPNHETFDLRPSPMSPANGAGAADRAPANDIQGRLRTAPIDIGAFAR